MKKALPRKPKEEAVKKTPTRKVATKQAGSTGKTRYGYPQDKQPAAKPAPHDPIPAHEPPKPKSVDPQEFATQLQIPLETLKRIAERFVANKKLGGSAGFVKFMRTRLKGVVDKHRLDGDYFSLLFQKLIGA